MKQKGFTLVELAIVLMIIGLLIGGILKGQELITNARIVSSMRQIKSYDTAILTFQDAYGYLPGDIPNPGTRLPNCAAASCNISGNGNGMIGLASSGSNNENNTFWLHLGATGLLSGINMNGTWTSANYRAFPFPTIPLYDNSTYVVSYASTASPTGWPEGLYGLGYYVTGFDAARTVLNTTPVNLIQRMDIKFDDGKLRYGRVRANSCTPEIDSANGFADSDGYDKVDPLAVCRYVILSGI